MRTCNDERQKRSVKGSTFKRDASALVLVLGVFTTIPPLCRGMQPAAPSKAWSKVLKV